MADAGAIIGRAFARGGVDVWGVCDFDPALLTVRTRAIARIPTGARSIVAAAFPYYVGAFAHRTLSRYAMLPDYHNVVSALLAEVCAALRSAFPTERFEPFVDISPLDEVEVGVRAGLGVRGYHTQLINPRYGSYLFLGEIVTTLRLPPSTPGPEGIACLGCKACVRACPGGALDGQGRLDVSRCLSHLTQKKRLSAEEEDAVRRGRLVWGCDVCADVCPYNRQAAYSPVSAFYRNILAVLTNNNLESAGRAWNWRGPEVLQRNLRLCGEHGDQMKCQ